MKKEDWKSVFVDEKGRFKKNEAVEIMNKLCMRANDYILIKYLIEISYNQGRKDEQKKKVKK